MARAATEEENVEFEAVVRMGGSDGAIAWLVAHRYVREARCPCRGRTPGACCLFGATVCWGWVAIHTRKHFMRGANTTDVWPVRIHELIAVSDPPETFACSTASPTT